jgi:hypothetical protein
MGDMARNQGGRQPTVVHVGGSGRAGWTVLIVPTAIGGAVLYLYCRVTGSSVWDLLYVSRSSLTAFRDTVQEGMTKVWEEMRRQKEELFRAVGGVMKKQEELKDSQEELLAKQAQMDERLRRVRVFRLLACALAMCRCSACVCLSVIGARVVLSA